jgi:hypothetical protein
MAWAKVHTDILSDPKLMRAARKGMAGLALLPWFIVAAKQADSDGRLVVGGEPMDADDLAEMIPGVTAAEVATALQSLTELGVLVEDNGALRFVAWHPRQAKPSDSKEAIRERVQRHRRRREGERRGRNAPVTPTCNAEVTPPCNAPVTDACNATEKRNPTGFLVTRGVLPVRPAAADAGRRARDIGTPVDEPDLAEPTPEERERARALAAELRAVEAP